MVKNLYRTAQYCLQGYEESSAAKNGRNGRSRMVSGLDWKFVLAFCFLVWLQGGLGLFTAFCRELWRQLATVHVANRSLFLYLSLPQRFDCCMMYCGNLTICGENL